MRTPTLLADTVMLVWPLVVLAVFWLFPARRAVVGTLIAAWLFLPMVGYRFEGVPDYTKMSATVASAFLGLLVFHPNLVLSFRPCKWDAPVIAWCLAQLAASIVNGLGLYDGLTAVIREGITWGLPYLLGRLVLKSSADLKALAGAVFIGGILYIPLCLLEIRFSPFLHLWLYGFHQHDFVQHIRFGGFRPMVFMQHGIMVGMWMAAASLVGVWMWLSDAFARPGGHFGRAAVVAIVLTTLWCKAVSGILLLLVGTAILMHARYAGRRLVAVILLSTPPIYMGVRLTHLWSGRELVIAARAIAGEDRAGSLESRLQEEDVLGAWALRQPVFGWGGWGRMFPPQMETEGVRAVDSVWLITLGTTGLLGLAAVFLIVLLPAARSILTLAPAEWCRPEAAAVPFSVLLLLWGVDCLFNGFLHPIYITAAGGLVSVLETRRRSELCVSEAALSRPLERADHQAMLDCSRERRRSAPLP